VNDRLYDTGSDAALRFETVNFKRKPGLASRAIYFNERAVFVPQNTGKSNKQSAKGSEQRAAGSKLYAVKSKDYMQHVI
jgi:hypothetical protein